MSQNHNELTNKFQESYEHKQRFLPSCFGRKPPVFGYQKHMKQ